jgi:hypothetical protein
VAFWDRLRTPGASAISLLESDPTSAAYVVPNRGRSLVSPWQDGAPAGQMVWSDLFGTQLAAMGRGDAMSVPAVARARSVLVGLIAGAPLVALGTAWREVQVPDADPASPTFGTMVTRWTQVLEVQPPWLQRTNVRSSPWHRMAWTLDDLLFSGWSLWAIKRGADGAILEAARCPRERWQIEGDGTLTVQDARGDFVPVDESSVLLIPGPFEGILAVGNRTLRGAVELERTWVARARNPIPAITLERDGTDHLDDDDVANLVQDWADARSDVNGAIGSTPAGIKAVAMGTMTADLFVEGRNYAKLDVANLCAMPASILDASVSTASLTYSTQEGRRNELAAYTVPYWADPIAHRLSLDDVVPAGTRIRFDFGDLYTTAPERTGTPTED